VSKSILSGPEKMRIHHMIQRLDNACADLAALGRAGVDIGYPLHEINEVIDELREKLDE
jgi:hypothetical protein